jgi:hypothetical protein
VDAVYGISSWGFDQMNEFVQWWHVEQLDQRSYQYQPIISILINKEPSCEHNGNGGDKK